METLARLEETALSIWLRESGPAFFSVLTLHSLAMGIVVGINIAISLRLAGFFPAIPLNPLLKFFPLLWAGVVLIVLSGLALLLAYPAKALTNPVFYLKLCALTAALLICRYFQKGLAHPDRFSATGNHVIRLACLTLLLWIVTVTAGRFLAYTNSVLLASRFY